MATALLPAPLYSGGAVMATASPPPLDSSSGVLASTASPALPLDSGSWVLTSIPTCFRLTSQLTNQLTKTIRLLLNYYYFCAADRLFLRRRRASVLLSAREYNPLRFSLLVVRYRGGVHV
jgi:hypothetical protein